MKDLALLAIYRYNSWSLVYVYVVVTAVPVAALVLAVGAILILLFIALSFLISVVRGSLGHRLNCG